MTFLPCLIFPTPSFGLIYIYNLSNKQSEFKSLSHLLHKKHSKPKQLSILKYKYSEDQNVKQSFIENIGNNNYKKIPFEIYVFLITETVVVIITSLLSKLFYMSIYSFNSYLDNILICEVISRNLDLLCLQIYSGEYSPHNLYAKLNW